MLLSCKIVPRTGSVVPIINPITNRFIESETFIDISESEFLKARAYGTVYVLDKDVSSLSFEDSLKYMQEVESKIPDIKMPEPNHSFKKKKKRKQNEAVSFKEAVSEPIEEKVAFTENNKKEESIPSTNVNENISDIIEAEKDLDMEDTGSYQKETDIKQDNNTVDNKDENQNANSVSSSDNKTIDQKNKKNKFNNTVVAK